MLKDPDQTQTLDRLNETLAGAGKPGGTLRQRKAGRFIARDDGWHEIKGDSKDGGPMTEWICGPVEVKGHTRNDRNENWGLFLSFEDREGHAHEFAVPMALFRGTGGDLAARLLDSGLPMGVTARAKKSVEEMVQSQTPGKFVRCTDRIGWHRFGARLAFVLPDGVVGESGEEVIYQSEGAMAHRYLTRGTLEAWRAAVAAPAAGNSRLVFAISAAFAAPLLGLLPKLEGGGFNLVGSSSIGKTTALLVAGSVWGGGGEKGYIRTWRATANGLEAVAFEHNHTLLCLDELGQADAREAGHVAYLLANGAGKSRATVHGGARRAAEWRTLFLSSGEQSLADKMAEDGRKVRAGQEIRVLDLPADAGVGLGCFEDLHDANSARELAEQFKAAVAANYGLPGRQFVAALASEAGLEDALAQLIERVGAELDQGKGGQVGRALQRFAVVGAGGILAIRYGLVPWTEGDVMDAARKCFAAWLERRGGHEPAEKREMFNALRRTIEMNGQARFIPIGEDGAEQSAYPVRDCLGYRETLPDGTHYFVSKPAMEEILRGHDLTAALRMFRDLGVLVAPESGHLTVKRHVCGERRRLYHVTPAILASDAPATEVLHALS